ncbi:hypothetical protein MNB_SUP05-5-630 [hydrothermal vent metagenome]|uniref:Ribbon-helix-helix protein CopG domain-containing protein n=1 Tax=hydrothermal vent metagenome TaxID=652676 RepID=A0A1W1C8L0_9ZZZZ
MHPIAELEKQQVGLRMPVYLLNELDELTSKYKVNRSDILIEATKSYIQAIKEDEVHGRLKTALKEVKMDIDGKLELPDARSLLDEL